MEDKKSELLQYAREYATANKDLYELLSVSADAAQPEVHRAWRKASLKHHPDKAKNFDPEIWQLFERARDVLSSPEARAAYDSARAAALQAQKARAALDAKRRAMIDDLEARERGVKRKGDGEMDGRHMMTAAEKRVLMEKGREHLEKRRRMKEEAEAREREREREHTRTEEEDAQSRGDARRDPERRSTQPDSVQIPVPTTSTNNATEDVNTKQSPPDEYDERVADLERKLRERKAEKAARKAGKKSNKARRDEDNNNNNNIADGDGEANTPPARTITTPTPLAATTEEPVSSSTSMPPPQQHQRQPPLTSHPARGDFSSTMAKLRAAQREKERKKAEAEAAAMAATTAVASDDNR